MAKDLIPSWASRSRVTRKRSTRTLQVARPALRVLLRQGNVRHRRLLAANPRQAFLAAAPFSEPWARSEAAGHRGSTRCPAPACGQEGAPRAHELRRVPHEAWKLDPGVLSSIRPARTDCSAPASMSFRRRTPSASGSRVRRHGPGSDGRAPARTTTRFAARKRRNTTSTSPTATRRSRGCSCGARIRRPPRLDDGRHRDSRADYAKLDAPGAPVANPPEQPVMRVRHTTAPAGALKWCTSHRQGGTLEEGQGAFRRPGVLAHHDSVRVSGAARPRRRRRSTPPSRCR